MCVQCAVKSSSPRCKKIESGDINMNWRAVLISGAGVAGASFLVLEIVRRAFHEWNIDFSNTAWGPITAALISGVVGVVLKGAMDARLAAVQGGVQQKVQTAVEATRADFQKELAAIQGDVQQKVQTAIEAERAHFQEKLTALKATLDDRNSASAARRDYEYEARKRLYDEVEPLLFQVYEALEEAHYRVRSLARTARNGDLGWLAGNGYYLASTVYKLLLPVAHLRLIQRRMTFVDLGLDPHIELRYLLLKLYARSFTDDFDFARTSPRLLYDPNHADWPKKREEEPAVYARQALVVGDLECVADLLINREGEKSRAISYGEFEALLSNPIDENLQEAITLFRGFSPQHKPVLARMLVSQACLSKFILSTYHAGDASGSLRQRYGEVVNDDLAKEVSWGTDHDEGFTVAADYWGSRLDLLSAEISARRPRATRSETDTAQVEEESR